jgi:uncharacterized protein YjbI with pentapeptide repeats
MNRLQPQRAAVRPRVLNAEGESVLLEEELRPLIEAGVLGAIALSGPTSSGKTTALEHLAAVFADGTPIQVAEGFNFLLLEKGRGRRLASRVLSVAAPEFALRARTLERLFIFAVPDGWHKKGWLTIYRMAPWGRDEWIEYLLAEHRERCAAVMARLVTGPGHLDCDSPALARVVMDQLANDDTTPDARTALLRHIAAAVPDGSQRDPLFRECLAVVQGALPYDLSLLARPAEGLSPKTLQLLRTPIVQRHLAAAYLVMSLQRGQAGEFLNRPLPHELIATTARSITGHRRVLQQLRDLLAGPDATHPMVASLLHLAESGWVPEGVHNLAGAYLARAAWPDVRLRHPCLNGADLSGAYLARARLSRCQAHRTNFSRAQLNRAVFTCLKAEEANFAHADLSFVRAWRALLKGANLAGAVLDDADLSESVLVDADLTGASLQGVDLAGAQLSKAKIKGADFRGANLARALLAGLRLGEASFGGACFTAARLNKADLEYIDLPGADFAGADLHGALLTGAILSEANFAGACLCEAGLADVNWEGACLRDVNLSGASFHLGSSRSGLVNSPIASEGSRTGFYTDDFEEQHFKAPEEIRKANLRGADLCGARLDYVDFYLVDLRDALFDTSQEKHLRQMGAILNDWKL